MRLFPIATAIPGTFPDQNRHADDSGDRQQPESPTIPKPKTSRISVNSGKNPAHSGTFWVRNGAFEGRIQ